MTVACQNLPLRVQCPRVDYTLLRATTPREEMGAGQGWYAVLVPMSKAARKGFVYGTGYLWVFAPDARDGYGTRHA